MFKQFRTGFLGKVGPVRFFWGSFDHAVTRFSGRGAAHPGGVPNLPDAVTREAYSHEVSSAGFWPGGGAIDYPAFYGYGYPTPEGFAAAPVRPEAAFFHQALGEFILPYDAVRDADAPTRCCWTFCRPPTRLRRTRRAGIAPRWKVRRAGPGFRGRSREASRSRR